MEFVILEFECFPSFSFLVFAMYGNIFLFKYSGYFVWDLHTLLDRGNLYHSDVLYRLCCLLRVLCLLLFGMFVQHSWHLVLFSEFTIFYSHFCLVLAFVRCPFFCSYYILPLFSVFNLSSFPLACMCFQPQILFLY